MHQIHTGRAPQYLVDSVQSVAESSRRPGLRSANTADYVKRCTRTKCGERCFSHAGPAAWNSLPASIKLTIDTNRFRKLLKAYLFLRSILTFCQRPGQFVSCALQIPICVVYLISDCFAMQKSWDYDCVIPRISESKNGEKSC